MNKKELMLLVQLYDGSTEVHPIIEARVNHDSIECFLKDGGSRKFSLDDVYEFEIYNARKFEAINIV